MSSCNTNNHNKKCCSEENIWILRDNYKQKHQHLQHNQSQNQLQKAFSRPNSTSITNLNNNNNNHNKKNVRFSFHSKQSDKTLNKLQYFDPNIRMNSNSGKTSNKSCALRINPLIKSEYNHHHASCLSSSSSGVCSSASSTKSDPLNISPQISCSSSSCSSSTTSSGTSNDSGHVLYSIVQKVPHASTFNKKSAPKAIISDDGDIIMSKTNEHTNHRVSFFNDCKKEKQRDAVLEYIQNLRNQANLAHNTQSQHNHCQSIIKTQSEVPIQRFFSKNQSIRHNNNNKNDSLGICYLMFGPETKRSILPNQVTSIDTIKALFVRSFTDKLTMKYLDEETSVRIYIKDPLRELFYQLDDINEIKDRCVLKLVQLNVDNSLVAFKSPSPPPPPPPSTTTTSSMTLTNLNYSNTQIASSTSSVYSSNPLSHQQQQQPPQNDKYYAYSSVHHCIPSVETYDNINEHSQQQQQQQSQVHDQQELVVEALSCRSGSVTPKFMTTNDETLSISASINSFNTLKNAKDLNSTNEINDHLSSLNNQSDMDTLETSKMKIKLMQQQLQTLTTLVHHTLATSTHQKQNFVDDTHKQHALRNTTIKLIDLNLKTKALQNELQNLKKLHKNFNTEINESLRQFVHQLNNHLKYISTNNHSDSTLDLREKKQEYEVNSTRIEGDLNDLEGVVEDLREQIITHKSNVNVNDIECYAMALSQLSKQLLSLKTSFSSIRNELKYQHNEHQELLFDKSKQTKEFLKPLTQQLQLQSYQSDHLPRDLLNEIENIRPNHEQRQLAIENSELSIKKRKNLHLQELIQNEIENSQCDRYCTQMTVKQVGPSSQLETVEEEDHMENEETPKKIQTSTCFTTQKTICLENYDNPYLTQETQSNHVNAYEKNESSGLQLKIQKDSKAKTSFLNFTRRNSMPSSLTSKPNTCVSTKRISLNVTDL